VGDAAGKPLPLSPEAVERLMDNLLRRPAAKLSLRGRRKAASWDDDFLASLFAR